MINSIELINWRSHSHTKIEFRKGTNLIIGIMGSGKSSILDGISYALFGTFPALESRRMKMSDLFRYESSELEVILDFEIDGKKYRVERINKKKGRGALSEALVYCSGKLMETGANAVTKFIGQAYKLDYDLFSRAIYSEQNNIDYFLSLNPKKRKEEFDRLLGLDRFEAARANVTSLVNRIKSRKEDIESVFDLKKMGECKHSIQEKGHMEKNFKEEFGKLELEKKEADLKIGKLEKIVGEFEIKSGKKIQFENQLIRAKALEQEYREQVSAEKIEDIDRKMLDGEIKDLKERSLSNREKIAKLRQQIYEGEMERGKIEGEIKRKKRIGQELGGLEIIDIIDLEKIAEKIRENEGKLIILTANKQRFLEKEKEIGEIFEKIRIEDGKCPFCNSIIDEGHAKKMRLEKEAEKKNCIRQAEEIKLEIVGLERTIKKMKDEEKQIKEIELKRKNSYAELEKIKFGEKDLGEMEKKIGKIKEMFEKIEKENEGLNRTLFELGNKERKIEEYKKINEKLTKINEMIPKIEKGIKDNFFEEKELINARKKLEENRILVVRAKEKMLSIKTEMEYVKHEIEKEIKELERLEKIKGEMEKISRIEEELLVYKSSIEQIQVQLRDELVKSINLAMNEVWEIIYPYKDYKKLRIEITENDYEFEIYDGEWKEIETIASGGERTCIALVLRIALSSVLVPNLSWLILDEPTHNLDKEGIGLLSETLQTRVPEIVKQALVITHEELLVGAGFSSSYKLSRDKENKGPTAIERL